MADIQIKIGVLIIRDGKLLLIKEWSNKRNGYFWNIVKGTFGDHQNETLVDCAIRECREEAGLDVEIKSLLHCVVLSRNDIRVQFNFMGSVIGQANESQSSTEAQKERGEDINERKWFAKEELNSISSEEFINSRAEDAVKAWINGEVYPLEALHSTES